MIKVQSSPIDLYVGGFRAWCGAMRPKGRPEVAEPGVQGLLAWTDDPLTRLVVTDDRASEALQAMMPVVRSALITVFPGAPRCADLIAEHQEWTVTTATAMICRDLQDLPVVPLPTELTLRPVRRLARDPSDGVPLLDAAAAAIRADPEIRQELGVFAEYLRSWPPMVRLLAAVDPDGAVRATAGSGTFGRYSSVMFVTTERGWRGRGIGLAMTAAALRAAWKSGAEQACLDSSDAGTRIYRSLGFVGVDRVTRFFRPASRPAA